MADNDNPSPLAQALQRNLDERQEALASSLADALRCAAAGEQQATTEALNEASHELRGVIAVVKHLGE